MRKYLGSTKTGLSVKGKITIKEEAFNTTHEAEEEEVMYTHYGKPRSNRGRAPFKGRGAGNYNRGEATPTTKVASAAKINSTNKSTLHQQC